MKITEALTVEHRIFLRMFDQIENALPSLTTPMEVRTIAGIVEKVLQDHARAESELAYLALDHVLEEKDALERMHQDHHEIDDRLRQAQSARTCAEGRQLVKSALLASREHFRGEERNLFPLLEKVLKPETLHELGNGWRMRAFEVASVS